MPIYEFECERCRNITEVMCPFNPLPDATICKWCGMTARRIISRTAKPVVKMGIHTDSGLPKEYIDRVKTPELFQLNKNKQGGVIDPEDM